MFPAAYPKLRRSRGRSLWIASLVLLLASGAILFTLRRSAPHLNVLLITLDTTRADRLGCYGYESALTPVLDKLAEHGVVFERAYAPAPLTLPSHATMLTGLYPPEHGLHNNGQAALPAGLPTLATQFRAAGYETGAFVAAVVLEKKYGLDRGFQTYDDDLSQVDESLNGHHRSRSGSAVVDAALNWLKPRTARPFFCWVHLFDPHYPYLAHADRFGDRFADQPYDAEIAYVDQQVGRLIDVLRQSGVDERTIVVIAGDHGESLGEHGELTHSLTLYDSALHVPWLMSAPGERSGGRVSQPVSLADLCPTVLDCAGLKTPEAISGRSLRKMIGGRTLPAASCFAETDEPYHHARWSPLRAVVTDGWKYIESPRAELYDLSQDPGELRNLIEEHPGVASEMKQTLDQWEDGAQRRLAENVALSESDRRALASLGYSAGARADEGRAESLPDVKVMLPYYNRLNDANAMMDAGRYDLAEPVLREIVEAQPEYFLAQGDLGRCLLRTDRPGEAIPRLRRNVELDPQADRVRALLGAALMIQGDYAAAAEELTIALRTSPALCEARYNLGLCLEKLGKPDDAREQYELCLEQVPHFTPARQRWEVLTSAGP